MKTTKNILKRCLPAFCFGAALLLVTSQLSFGDVRIWDNDTASWNSTLAHGDPIDTGNPRDAVAPKTAIDSNDIVYFVYKQNDAAGIGRIYLSRYDGTNPDNPKIQIWNHDADNWTTALADGTPIDTGSNNDAINPRLAVDSDNKVYVAYQQSLSGKNHIYLSRYDGTDPNNPTVQIWDNDIQDWTTALADGDPIDTGSNNDAINPRLAVDSDNKVYVAYQQSLSGKNHIYLSRYDGTDPNNPTVQIWDNDIQDWTTALADGDPIDTGSNYSASDPRLAVDSNDRLFVAFVQQDSQATPHIYLSRYDGTDPNNPTVQIWNHDADNWTTALADGTPIDTGSNYSASDPRLAVDSNDRLFVAFVQQDSQATPHIYLNRYDGTDPNNPTVQIWDNGIQKWTTNLTDGSPIDTGNNYSASDPRLAIDSNDRLFVAFVQQDSSATPHIYLSRYDESPASSTSASTGTSAGGGGGCFISIASDQSPGSMVWLPACVLLVAGLVMQKLFRTGINPAPYA